MTDPPIDSLLAPLYFFLSPSLSFFPSLVSAAAYASASAERIRRPEAGRSGRLNRFQSTSSNRLCVSDTTGDFLQVESHRVAKLFHLPGTGRGEERGEEIEVGKVDRARITD